MNFKKWEEVIKKPDWYFKIVPDLREFMAAKTSMNEEAYAKEKESVYDFFEEHLRRGDITLGSTGKNWDSDRKTIDTIIIHHTEMKRGLTPIRLSAVILCRLYMTYFAEPYDKRDEEVKGQPIYSGHFREGEQVFWPYHWIVREGGKYERLLRDDEIGWQAGNWDVNCRSVAIVLDNNYENSIPPRDEIVAIAEIIRKNYPNVKIENILGHREVNPKTTCPSNLFLSENGWKNDLLRLVFDNL